jgi:hypothetical protein
VVLADVGEGIDLPVEDRVVSLDPAADVRAVPCDRVDGGFSVALGHEGDRRPVARPGRLRIERRAGPDAANAAVGDVDHLHVDGAAGRAGER